MKVGNSKSAASHQSAVDYSFILYPSHLVTDIQTFSVAFLEFIIITSYVIS